MNRVKPIFILLICTVIYTTQCFAQEERRPQYPGGSKAFTAFIKKNLKYPEVAKLVGLSGKVNITFVIDQNGKIGSVTPISCLGAGCESEAARVISLSKDWIPGTLYGRPVRVQYTVPISFGFTADGSGTKIKLKDLRNSDYGFAFYIKGKAYSIDEAEQLMGKNFNSADVITAEPFDDPKFSMPGKKVVYLIVMKDN